MHGDTAHRSSTRLLPHSSQTALLGQPGRSRRPTKSDRRDGLI